MPSTTERGYGYSHQLRRKRWQERIDAGEDVHCWRCGKPILPGDEWHLGHDDNDRRIYRGPECPKGNLEAGARKGGLAAAAKRASQSRAPGFTSGYQAERNSRRW